MKEHHYATKTEFIRESIRDKLTELEKKQALERLDKVYGAGKGRHRYPTKEEFQKARELAVKEMDKFFKDNPQVDTY